MSKKDISKKCYILDVQIKRILCQKNEMCVTFILHAFASIRPSVHGAN